MSPQQAAEEQRRAERLQRELQDMREDLLNAIINGTWAPEGPVPWPKDSPVSSFVQSELAKLPAGNIEALHKEMTEAVAKDIDDKTEADLRETLQLDMDIDVDSPLYNPMMDQSRRKRIEADLKPLDFESLVFQGSCEQEIPLRDGFTVTFRTLSTQHALWLEYHMSRQEETSMQHTRHLFSLMQIACSLSAINGRKWGTDLSKYMRPDQRQEFITAMNENLALLGSLPGVLSDDLIVQYVWFSGRVRKLLAGDLMRKVGNS